MNFLKNLSIRNKLIVISMIPLIALAYYLQITIRKEIESKKAAERVLADVEEINAISKVLHEIQKERAHTLSIISGKNGNEKQQLIIQRENTDKAVFELKNVLKEQNGSIQGEELLDSLEVIRARINKSQPLERIDPVYIGIKENLLDEVSTILRSSHNPILKNLFEEHLFLLYTKEFLAQIRSVLATAFTRGKFEENEYGRFASMKGKHEINLEKIKKIASPELKEFFNKKYSGPFILQTYLIIDSVFYAPDQSLAKYNNSDWLAVSTNSINSLKEIEDYSGNIISHNAKAELASANDNVVLNSIIAILVILLIVLLVTSTIREIVNSINRIKDASEKLAKGDVSQTIEVKSKDEIGNLAVSFNKIISVTKEFSEVADTIGKGDYSPTVNIRGESDQLGYALDNMKNNLQKLSKENEVRTWLLTGNAQLNDKMRGERDIKSLAQDVVTQLTSYLKAQIGAIYLMENNRLNLVGSYAFNNRKENSNSFKLGQGLVGQAALEKKPIIFNEVPNDYISINSGLGKANPRSIIVFPFLYDKEIKGVIEIGAAHEFSDLDMEFLNMVGENAAIAFTAAESRTQMKELLEETQRQAEELETQQEELKQSNEELEEKTELLEKSEAELKAQQEELQQSNEELEEKANLLEEQKEKLELTKIELERKANELEVTGKYKSEFLANMSHELRTPLNSILILSQLLTENKSNTLKEKEINFAKNIYNSGTDLLNLINEILDLSKVESGKIELDIEEVEINEIAEDIKAMFAELAKNRSIDFNINLNQKDLKGIVTDKQRLEQILKNLLSNAFKFTDSGGTVTLNIENAISKTVKNKKLSSLKKIASFSVADTGIGIPKDKQAIVFEAFQQADGSTKRKYGGTGLGLSISRELANALGGELQLISEEGKGSTFTLYLPLKFDASIMNHTERSVEIKEKRKIDLPVIETTETLHQESENLNAKDDRYNLKQQDKIILIIEDDPDFAEILLEFIRERNYKGILAHEGNTGLSYARHYKPDAIILDMKLPVMNGDEVLTHLKNDPELRHIPVQIISGHDKRKVGMELGAFDFMRKPISKEDFQRAFMKIEDFMNKQPKKLLIVEDNENQNKAIRELIGNGDVKSFSAYSGNEAYEIMSKQHFDCVIIDLGLPDMTGFELMEKIKSNNDLKKIPIIVYTGKDLTKEETAKLNKLANTVVLKTADSHERLLDETTLFLHRIESRLPKEKQNIIRTLHKTEEVLKGKKVLVVDDDIRNIYSLSNALEEEGVQCLSAENGKVALQMLKDDPSIDIVLMDVMMPEMDGYEATKEIRKIERFNKLPIIALTAKAMKGDREKCLNAGMSDYISKPVNIEQLLSLMRVWMYSK